MKKIRKIQILLINIFIFWLVQSFFYGFQAFCDRNDKKSQNNLESYKNFKCKLSNDTLINAICLNRIDFQACSTFLSFWKSPIVPKWFLVDFNVLVRSLVKYGPILKIFGSPDPKDFKNVLKKAVEGHIKAVRPFKGSSRFIFIYFSSGICPLESV